MGKTNQMSFIEEDDQQDQIFQTTHLSEENTDSDSEEDVIQWRPKQPKKKPNKRAPQVCLEGYLEPSDDDVLPRTKSLTDDDLDELKGCVDLGFGFNYEEIPELCSTLPALELCYSMSQKFLDDHPNQNQHLNRQSSCDTASFSSSGSDISSPLPTWKISSPGDHPEDVKARLKFWAQAVACTVKLCSSS